MPERVARRLVISKLPREPHPMHCTVNGRAEELPDGLTVEHLLDRLGLRVERVAVERNRALVTRREYATTTLADGDVLEIVTFVGGGAGLG